MSSSWARCICARSCKLMPAITTRSGRTDHWIKMRRSPVRFSRSEALNRTLSLVDFITTTFESRFSVHTPPCAPVGKNTLTKRPENIGPICAEQIRSSANILKPGGGRSRSRTRLQPREFPANREINREFRRIPPRGAILKAGTRANSEPCTEIPYSAEQGIVAKEQGIFAKEQGICMQRTGNFSRQVTITAGRGF